MVVYSGSTILGEKLPNGGEIYYFFDENGVRYGFARGTNLYYYAYNGQGDVIEIYNSGGRLEAWYKYDSWGKVTEMGGNLAVAEMNPIRYRGYYYDTETGFYYLNSRYYDPETCRFINADGYVSTGQGLLSGNMFAYCLNNPVSNEDSSGSIPMRVKYCCDGGGKPHNIVDDFIIKLKGDFANFNKSNTKEQKVINAHFFSSYKGVLAVKTPFKSSASFGVLMISNSATNVNTIKHEYGHRIQLNEMGVAQYTTNVAIPSVTANLLNRMNKLPYDYYGSPWEHEANVYGGWNRDDELWPEDACDSYWDLIKLFFE